MLNDPRVALTFDNGPEPGVTERVLDVLRAQDIRATFFVIGRKLAAPGARALAERAVAEGHRVGNHTWSHATPLGLLDSADSVAEIARTQAELGALGPERLFRPYGVQGRIGAHLLSAAARDHLAATRATCVLWNVLPRDWLEPDDWVETALAMCAARPWSLMVLHDIASGAMRRLPEFLDRARAAGAQFVTGFPDDCVPIRDGVIRPGCEAYVTEAATAP